MGKRKKRRVKTERGSGERERERKGKSRCGAHGMEGKTLWKWGSGEKEEGRRQFEIQILAPLRVKRPSWKEEGKEGDVEERGGI